MGEHLTSEMLLAGILGDGIKATLTDKEVQLALEQYAVEAGFGPRLLVRIVIRRLAPLMALGAEKGAAWLGDRYRDRTLKWLAAGLSPEWLRLLRDAIQRLQDKGEAKRLLDRVAQGEFKAARFVGRDLLSPEERRELRLMDLNQRILDQLDLRHQPPLDVMGPPRGGGPGSELYPAANTATLTGRDEEIQCLNAFLLDGRPFCWHVLEGPAGTGKIRLAYETLRMHEAVWGGGFLSRDRIWQWDPSCWTPDIPTLLVLDIPPGGETVVSTDSIGSRLEILERRAAEAGVPVRLLVTTRRVEEWFDDLLGGTESVNDTARATAWPTPGPDQRRAKPVTRLGGLSATATSALIQDQVTRAKVEPHLRETILAKIEALTAGDRRPLAVILATRLAVGDESSVGRHSAADLADAVLSTWRPWWSQPCWVVFQGK